MQHPVGCPDKGELDRHGQDTPEVGHKWQATPDKLLSFHSLVRPAVSVSSRGTRSLQLILERETIGIATVNEVITISQVIFILSEILCACARPDTLMPALVAGEHFPVEV